MGEWRLVPTRANRMPAAASYLRRPGETEFRAFKIDVLRVPRRPHRRDHDVRRDPFRGVRAGAGASGLAVELGQLPLEQPPLGVVVHERERARVGRRAPRRRGRAGAAARRASRAGSGSRRAPARRRSPARPRALGLGDRHRAAELDDRRAGEARELAVERGDLRPVARLVGVQRRDRRLQHVRPAAAQRQRAVERRAAGGDLRASQSARSWSASSTSSPSRKRAARRASCSSISASRPCTSGSSGISSASARPSRIASAARSPRPRVALVEDQVDDGEHRGEPVGQQVVGRHAERDPGGLDLALGAHEPLRHRRLGRRGTRARSRASSARRACAA